MWVQFSFLAIFFFSFHQSFLQAQVKKELENENTSNSKTLDEPKGKEKAESEIEIPKNFAASGVYFK